jgi:antibiotic biosynthesis monooxygenase (ABM) superfamily enzyme
MIRVLIERHIADELGPHYDKLSREILQRAMHTPGFISGEVMHNADDPNHRLVLATYRTLNDWERWYNSAERRDMLQTLGPLLESDEKITVFEH